MFRATSQAVQVAKNEPWRRLQRPEAALKSTPRLSSDDADDRAYDPLSLAVHLVVMKVMSRMMLNLSSLADEAALKEAQRLDAETAVSVDLRKQLSEPHARPLELGCWSDHQPIIQPNDENVTSDSRHVEL